MFIVNWVKQNKLAFFLLVVVAYFIFKGLFGYSFRSASLSSSLSRNESYGTVGMIAPAAGVPLSKGISLPEYDATPQTDVGDRMVIQESYLSLLVGDVVDVRNNILSYVKENGGYMVNSSTSNPKDAPTANIAVRIPSEKLQESLDYFHSQSIKVVSENLVGKDVTDQYIDIETRISQLEKTKQKFESILESATKVSDITELTQQILNYQSQIDSYKGQQESLKKNAQLAKLTIYLSTDEIALPYAPSETFRPNVIFKLAIRSLISSLRELATYAIWIGVYSVVWVPILIVIFIARKVWIKRTSKN